MRYIVTIYKSYPQKDEVEMSKKYYAPNSKPRTLMYPSKMRPLSETFGPHLQELSDKRQGLELRIFSMGVVLW